MNSGRKFVFVMCVCVLLVTAGCDKLTHKRQATIPKHGEAPTVSAKLPDSIPENPEPPPVVVVHEEPPPVETKTPPKARKHSTGKKNANSNAVVAGQNSSASGTSSAATRPPDVQAALNTAIAPDVSTASAVKDKQQIAQVLDSTEKAVKGIDDKTLSEDEKAMLSQIYSYISQSKKATDDGDLERALNLANKAHLLSDALIKK